MMIYGLVHFSLESGVMQPVRYVHHLRLKFAKRSFHGGLQEFREHYADTVNRCIHSSQPRESCGKFIRSFFMATVDPTITTRPPSRPRLTA